MDADERRITAANPVAPSEQIGDAARAVAERAIRRPRPVSDSRRRIGAVVAAGLALVALPAGALVMQQILINDEPLVTSGPLTVGELECEFGVGVAAQRGDEDLSTIEVSGLDDSSATSEVAVVSGGVLTDEPATADEIAELQDVLGDTEWTAFTEYITVDSPTDAAFALAESVRSYLASEGYDMQGVVVLAIGTCGNE